MLNEKQLDVKNMIERASIALDIDPTWAISIAMVESSLGMNQKSKTGARGIFQMTNIAMKDLLQEMEKSDNEIIDVLCGLLFLKLLLNRWHTIEDATTHFCDPVEKQKYWLRVEGYMDKIKRGEL